MRVNPCLSGTGSAVLSLASSIQTLSDAESQSEASAPVANDLFASAEQSSGSQAQGAAETGNEATTSRAAGSANPAYKHTGALYSTVPDADDLACGLADELLSDRVLSPAEMSDYVAYPTELHIMANPEDEAPNPAGPLSPAMGAWLKSNRDGLLWRLRAGYKLQEQAK